MSEDKCAKLECCQGTPIKQNKFLQGFSPPYFETDYLYPLLSCIKQLTWKTRDGMRQTEYRSNAQQGRRK